MYIMPKFKESFIVLTLFLLLILGITTSPTVYAKTVACDGQTLSGQSQQTQTDFKERYGDNAAESWVDEHEAAIDYCRSAGDSGGSSGSSSGSSGSSGGSSSSCDIGRQDPNMTKDCASCMASDSPGVISTIKKGDSDKFGSCTDRQILNYWCNGGVGKQGSSDCNSIQTGGCKSVCGGTDPVKDSTTGTSGGSSSGNQTPACEQASQTYYDAKVATRLALYYSIISGIPESCVKADLGVPGPPALTAKNLDGKEGRLFLCSGADSKAGNLVLKWRVEIGTGLEQVQNPPGTDPDNLINKDYVKKAETLLSVSKPNIAPSTGTTETKSSNELKPGGKECIYNEGNTCHKGNCLDGSQNCSDNVNCGYVPNYSSGETVACPGSQSTTESKDSCPKTFQYNQCKACNQSESVYKDCNGEFHILSTQFDAACGGAEYCGN